MKVPCRRTSVLEVSGIPALIKIRTLAKGAVQGVGAGGAPTRLVSSYIVTTFRGTMVRIRRRFSQQARDLGVVSV